ncbi:MAG: hypothetical protein V4787_21195 [Pseudomonadota bacterium]
MAAWTSVIALLFAFCVDRWIGEPAPRWHPVEWMRGYLQRSRGTTAWWAAAATVTLGSALLQWGLAQLDEAIAGVLLGVLLSPLLGWRSVRLGVIQRAQEPPDDVEHEPVIGALIGGASSAVVAPVLWFVLAGLPGVALYRFADAAHLIWGRRVPWAMRFDEVMSWLPVRITAWLFSAFSGGRAPADLARETTLPEGLRLANLTVASMLAWSCLAIFLFAREWPW